MLQDYIHTLLAVLIMVSAFLMAVMIGAIFSISLSREAVFLWQESN
jgi:hypothetical protein